MRLQLLPHSRIDLVSQSCGVVLGQLTASADRLQLEEVEESRDFLAVKNVATHPHHEVSFLHVNSICRLCH
ncbi:hypothetical protein, partial [Longimicrobium sp.]|uniref:hypothetical protein n=1 Tax=Longimicrobium sp. TaxID=2029185 RepID=UPI002E314AEC